MLVAWNQTDEPVPAPYFHERVAEIAQATPHARAVVWPGGTMTFRELDADANRLAHRLRKLGVHRGDRVGTCFPRGPESLIAQLACFKVGAAAILLDPDFPADRVQFMIVDGEAKLTLTMNAHREVVTGHVVTLDGDDWWLEAPTPINSAVGPDDLIHICYTSGVDRQAEGRHGPPRRGPQPHLLHAHDLRRHRASRGTWLAAPGCGMVEVECFSVLAAGAPVHIPEPSVVTSPEWLRDWLVTSGITAHAAHEGDVRTPLGPGLALRDRVGEHPHLRRAGPVVAARSALPRLQPRTAPPRPPSSRPATSPNSGRNSANASGPDACRPSAGPRPTCGPTSWTSGSGPVPPGVVGELCVAGREPVVRLPQPAPRRPPRSGSRTTLGTLYRTGDLARFWTDGSIEIVGRT